MRISEARDAGPVTTAARIPTARATAPKGFEPGVRYEAGLPSEVITDQVPTDVQGDPSAWANLIAELGLTLPDGYHAELVEARYDPMAWSRDAATYETADGSHRKTPAVTRPAWRYKFRIIRTAVSGEASELDMTALLKVARANRRKPPKVTSGAATRTRIVAPSDEQIGKVDRNGGTEEFLARVQDVTAQLVDEMKERPCEDAVMPFGGDLIEGFESHGGQGFTNDLSHPESLALARAYVTDIITTVAAHHQHTRILAVPSNHAAWRKGADYLGKPSDDYGLDVMRAVAETLDRDPAFKDRVTLIFPEQWEVSLAITVRDDVVGLTHGHVGTAGSASFKKWFDGQLRGDAPVAGATILYNGHWHHHLMEPLGNIGGRERVRIQLPALDGGSSHFTNAAGDQSEAGLLTHVINDGGGWDHLRVLRAR